MCLEQRFAQAFEERRWKSNGGWMAPTGCAFGSAICACATVRNRRARQVLPAYGLQAFPRTEYLNLKKGFLQITHGGHFNMAETRTFLLCVDRSR